MASDADSSSSSSSSASSGDGRRRLRRDSTSSASSASSTGSETETGDEGEEEQPASSGISPLACILLVLILAVAGGLLVFFLERKDPPAATGTGGGGGSGGTAGSAETGTARGTKTTAAGTSNAVTGAPAATPIATDFLDSLASSFSLTPAALSTLAMPSSAIPSASAANSYIQDSWSRIKGSGETLSFVEDPLDGDGGIVLEVDYPKGSYTGSSDNAGVGNMQMAVFGEGKQRAMVSYDVGFNEGFDFVKGGKLPGLFGGDAGAGCTGGRGSESCFSLRLMWRENGAGEVYAYIPTYDGQCTEGVSASSISCHTNDGISINRGSFTFEAGSWNTVTEVAILNSDPSPDGEANGVLALYAGETRAIYLENVVFRTNASVVLNAFIFSTFFGGSTESYAATADCSTYYRNVQFWEGDDASTVTGETVQAGIGE
ncbi:hypothetical protein JCM10449v2_002903 [Rhodotorula kratochvilovae]